MANHSSGSGKKSAPWHRPRPMGSLPGLIALIGAVALLVTWLLQSSALTGRIGSASAGDSGLRINEVMSANASTQVGNEAGIEDWIELKNTSSRAIDLTGYALVRETRPAQAFAFPGGVLQPGECVLVHADNSGKALQSDGYHAPFRLPASGEHLALIDKSGEGVDLVELPALARDQVYCRDASGNWAVSDYPTPGSDNRVERWDGTDENARPIAVVPGRLEISEVMADNATFFMDETGAFPDYVEIHNISGAPLDLEGWSLSDKSDKLTRWQLPQVTLPADGYLAVHCSGSDRRRDAAHLHAGFRISNKGDNVYLTDPYGVTVSHVKTPVMEPDQCYSLLETGWSKQFSPSPNQPNTPEGADAAAREVLTRNDTGVRITEVLASSSKSDDWIELYNGTSAAVDLSGWGLSDNAGRPRKWQFPS
ncbi:MAG: lamin tail domain-containing protein, partial [Clostridia bacterium]|nr:lamin tail domain-containing protein [Clostridia bacterium]